MRSSTSGVERSKIDVLQVPGAFELPLGAMALAKTKRYACVIALGCVIRGETPHFEFISAEAASGVQLAALETGVPGGARRPHVRHARAGGGAVGRRARQQGRRGGSNRRSRWPTCSRGCASRTARPPARPESAHTRHIRSQTRHDFAGSLRRSHHAPPIRRPRHLRRRRGQAIHVESVNRYTPSPMSKVCAVCGKGPSFGNNRSHSMVATKRRFEPNLQRVRILVNGTPRRSYVCTRCLKAGKVQKAL